MMWTSFHAVRTWGEASLTVAQDSIAPDYFGGSVNRRFILLTTVGIVSVAVAGGLSHAWASGAQGSGEQELSAYSDEQPAEVVAQAFEYAGSSGLAPLKGEVRYPASGGKLPLVVVMHGYSGTVSAVVPKMERLAQRGVFAVGVQMRGRGGSAGTPDSGGLEILDIYDAVQYVLGHFADRIDPLNVNLWGYSGGGGNAFSCAVRFPDLFNQIASFFGISDYAYWYSTSSYADRIAAQVGGTPDEVPWAYASRRALEAVGNNPLSKIHIFWDEMESACNPWMNKEYLRIAEQLGLINVVGHESKTTQPQDERYIHGNNKPGVRRAEENILLPEIFSSQHRRELSLPDSGHLEVPGFVITRHFQLWVGSGVEGTMSVDYNMRPGEWCFRLVKGELAPNTQARLVCSRVPQTVEVNGTAASIENLSALQLPCEVTVGF